LPALPHYPAVYADRINAGSAWIARPTDKLDALQEVTTARVAGGDMDYWRGRVFCKTGILVMAETPDG
jgi:hypothetical protein